MYDVFLDFTCPWCLIGHHHIRQALSTNPHHREKITYRAFQLNPHLPPEGIGRMDYRINKFGSLAESQRRDNAIAQHAQTLGLTIDFSRITRTPNTRAVHRMIKHAKKQHVDLLDLYDDIFAAYFFAGKDLADSSILQEIARSRNISLDVQDLTKKNHDIEQQIDQDIADAQQSGILGVPFFVKNDGQQTKQIHLQQIIAILASK